MKNIIKKYYLNAVFFQSLIATMGSLFFSEVVGLTPCAYCWYQRILMYPIVLLSAVGVFSKDKSAFKYILPLSIPGMLIAGYHYLLQKTGIAASLPSCSTATPCSNIEIQYLGFITIPLMSFTAFLIINLVILVYYRFSRTKE